MQRREAFALGCKITIDHYERNRAIGIAAQSVKVVILRYLNHLDAVILQYFYHVGNAIAAQAKTPAHLTCMGHSLTCSGNTLARQ